MRRLVEEIQVAAGATDALTRVLYLTNMQAQLFKGETVPMMLDAFAVRPSSLVINLMEGEQYPSMYQDGWGGPEAPEGFYELQPQNVQGPSTPFASTLEATQATQIDEEAPSTLNELFDKLVQAHKNYDYKISPRCARRLCANAQSRGQDPRVDAACDILQLAGNSHW